MKIFKLHYFSKKLQSIECLIRSGLTQIHTNLKNCVLVVYLVSPCSLDKHMLCWLSNASNRDLRMKISFVTSNFRCANDLVPRAFALGIGRRGRRALGMRLFRAELLRNLLMIKVPQHRQNLMSYSRISLLHTP